jgi:hypothetical protein
MNSKPDDDRLMPLAGQHRQPSYGSPPRGGYQRQGYGEAIAKSFIRAIAASLGRFLVRAITRRLR